MMMMMRMMRVFYYLIKKFSFSFVGDINKKIIVSPIYINDKEFGETTDVSSVLEINIKEKLQPNFWEKYLLNKVGEIVEKKYFDFDCIFNVSFSCSKPKIFGKDKYADPYSIWFNVFLGYYEIDISPSEREYPFGYKPSLSSKNDLVLNPEEILKIGKSDWNYFSNFLYGVPFDEITDDVTKIYPSEVDNCTIEDVFINDVKFLKLTVESFKVISSYQAKNGKNLKNKWNNFLWKIIFGFPVSRKGFPDSFIPTNMKAVMYVYNKYITGDYDLPKEHSTFIFGGTINLDYSKNAMKNPKNKKSEDELISENNRFLELQLKEIRKIIPKVLNL